MLVGVTLAVLGGWKDRAGGGVAAGFGTSRGAGGPRRAVAYGYLGPWELRQ